MKIITNHHWREFCYREDVPADVLASQFDWTSEDHENHGDYSDGFLHYRGVWYHLADFMLWACPASAGESPFPEHEWDGYHSDSFFSGVLIKLSDDGERYQIATYYSVSD